MRTLRHSLTPYVVVAVVSFATVACDTVEDDPRCDIFQTCDVQNPLSLTLIESTTRLPAHVSLLFKVDTHTDEPVPNLKPTDFDIFENENLISHFESSQSILSKTGQFKYSIVLLLDLSGSIVASENLEGLKEAAQRFVDAIMFEENDSRYGEIEMSIWWFDGQAEMTNLVPFTVAPALLSEGLQSINASLTQDNSTNLYGAIIEGVTLTRHRLTASLGQDILAAGSVVLFTDGTDQANRKSRKSALQAVEEAGADISIYSIGLGGEIDPTTLTAIGLNGFVSAANLNDLVPRFQEIGDLVRNEANSYYLLEYCSPKRNGDNALSVKVRAGDRVGVLSTRFSAKNFTSGCVIGGV